MIHRLHHTAISTPDLARAVAFYRDLFGFEVEWTTAWEPGSVVTDRIVGLRDSSARAAMLRLGDTRLELFQYATPQPRPADPARPVCDHGITHICMQVSDVDAEHARLAAAGMVFHCPPQDAGEGFRATYGRDPDGNVIELLQQQGD